MLTEELEFVELSEMEVEEVSGGCVPDPVIPCDEN